MHSAFNMILITGLMVTFLDAAAHLAGRVRALTRRWPLWQGSDRPIGSGRV
jgi:hypothetical protein